MIQGIDDEFVVKMTELWKDLKVVDLCNGVVMQRVIRGTDPLQLWGLRLL